MSATRKLLLAALVAGLAGLPLAVGTEYALNTLVMLFLYVILAQSWNLLGGFAGQISLGHSAFFGMGALVTRLLWVGDAPVLVALLGGSGAAALLAAAVGIPCLRMRSAYFPIGTLALAMIAQITVANLFPVPGSLSGEYLRAYSLPGRYYLALAASLLTVGVVRAVVRSRKGLALTAIRDDEGAAEAMGVHAVRHKVLALLVSSALAGLGGGIFAYHQVSYYYSGPFELSWSFLPPLTTFIGGLGTLGGPVVGAVLFLAMSELFAISLGEVHVLVFGFTFILIVLFLPGGLMSFRERIGAAARRAAPRTDVRTSDLVRTEPGEYPDPN